MCCRYTTMMKIVTKFSPINCAADFNFLQYIWLLSLTIVDWFVLIATLPEVVTPIPTNVCQSAFSKLLHAK